MEKIKTAQTPIVWLVLVAFLVNTLIGQQPVRADVAFLPPVGQMVPLTPSFDPPMILGLKVYKDNPFQFEFIMSPGDDSLKTYSSFERKLFLKTEAHKLVRYFLASLTVPEKDMWVNLSPYNPDRIIASEFGVTEMGKDMLAQDYLLKQVTSSVMYPDGSVGREFWNKIYKEAYQRFGTTNIKVDTFNKVWIIPDKATVYENAIDNTAVVVESRLKVMLEEDYQALNKHKDAVDSSSSNSSKDVKGHALASQLIREIVIPALEKEVNTGKNFAVLRQIYNSLILAFWYKNKLTQSLISKGYVDRKKVNGVDVADKEIAREIFNQYVKAYKKGVYNYVKEDIGPDNQVIPRKYFSGGVAWDKLGAKINIDTGKDLAMRASQLLQTEKVVTFNLGVAATIDKDHLSLKPTLIDQLTTKGIIQTTQGNEFRVDLNGIFKYRNELNQTGRSPPRTIVPNTPYLASAAPAPVIDPAGRFNLMPVRDENSDEAMLSKAKMSPFYTFFQSLRIPRYITALTLGLALFAGAHSAYGQASPLTTPAPVQAQQVLTQQAGNNIQRLNQVMHDVNETYRDNVEVGRIFQATAHPIVPRFRTEAKMIDQMLQDSNFIQSLPENQRANVIQSLENLKTSINDVTKTWGQHSEKGSQSSVREQHSNNLQTLAKAISDSHRIINDTLNGQSSGGNPSAQVTPSTNSSGVNAAATNTSSVDNPGTHGVLQPIDSNISLSPTNGSGVSAVDSLLKSPLDSMFPNNTAQNLTPLPLNSEMQSLLHTIVDPLNLQPMPVDGGFSLNVTPPAAAPGPGGNPPPTPNFLTPFNNFILNALNPSDVGGQAPINGGLQQSQQPASQPSSNIGGVSSTNSPTDLGSFQWVFNPTNNYVGASHVSVPVPISGDQYKASEVHFNQISGNPDFKDNHNFTQDQRNDNNWRALQDKLLDKDAPYFVIVDTSKTNMYGIKRVFSKWQGDGSGHDSDSYMDFLYTHGFDQTGQANVSFKIRVPPQNVQGKLDISGIDTWQEIDNPLAIDQWQRDHKDIYVQVSWMDRDGHPESGVIYASHKAAQVAHDFMAGALRDRVFTQDLMNILSIPDYQQQKIQAERMGVQVKDDQSRGNTFVGAYVQRDQFGFITKVTGFISARDISVKVSNTPVNHEDIVITQNGANPRVVKYWPYSTFKSFSFLTQEEQNRLNDPNTAGASFNAYLYRDGNPLSRGEIFLDGNNNNIKSLMDVRIQEVIAEKNREAMKQYKRYLGKKINANVLFSAANIGLSFTGLNIPVNSGGNMIFDLIERPDQIGRYLPTEQELRRVLDAYNASQPEKDRIVLVNGSLECVKGFYTEDDMTKLNAYIKRINDQKTKFFFLNQVSMAAEIASHYLPSQTAFSGQYQFKIPENQALYDVLSQRYVSFTGELNIPNVVSLLARGQANQYVSLKNMANNGNFIDKLTSIVGVTVDLKSVVNEVSGTDAFPLAPSKTRINFYLFGFPISLLHEKDLVDHIDTILNDNVSDMFIIEDGHFKSTATAYNMQEFRSLYKTLQAIPIGKVSRIGIDGHPLEVPVYQLEMITPEGKHVKKVAIFTLKALKEKDMDVQKDLKRYEGYSKSLNEGGTVLQYSSQGGTFNQNIYTGLFESFDQQGAIGYSSAYTFDQGEADLFFIKTGHLEPVRRNLDFYMNVMKAQLKMGKFQGLGKSYNAYNGDAADQPDVAGTGIIAQTIMAYEKQTKDQRYHQLLTESIKWLEKVQDSNGGRSLPNSPGLKGKYAEPNAMAYTALHGYGSNYNDKTALRAAERIRQWASGLWDNSRFLIRSGEGQNTFSADAQTRWFLALGPQEFARTFFHGNTGAIVTFLKTVENTFSVTVLNQHSGQDVTLLDIADGQQASHRLTNARTERTLRIGMPEVTAEFVQVLKTAKPFLQGADLQFADSTEHKYSTQLSKMVDEVGSLPQATEENEDTGFNGRTVVGRRSLASAAQYQLSVVLGDNVLDLNSPHYGNNLGLTPADVHTPVRPLTFEDLNQGATVLGGKDNFTQWSAYLSDVIEKDKQQHNPNLIYHDPNGQQIIYRNADGQVINLSLIAPPEKIQQQANLQSENLKMNELMNQAKLGEGEFERGGVIFQTPEGQRVGTLYNSQMVNEVLKAISKLSVQEQALINYKQYSGFMLRGFNVDGHVQDVVVNMVFPLHKAVTYSAQDPNNGLTTTSIIEDGRVRFMVNDQTVVMLNYDSKTGVETSSLTFSNTTGNRDQLVQKLMGMKSLEERANTFKDTVPLGETKTISARYIDPKKVSIDNIDPNQPILVKSVINYSTGNISTKAYGLFTLPVWEADQFSFTTNHFNDAGRFVKSEQYKNTGTLQVPAPGQKLFENTVVQVKNGKVQALVKGAKAEAQEPNTWIFQHDVVHSRNAFVVLDNLNMGRMAAKYTTDNFTNPDGTKVQMQKVSVPQYRPDFYGGQVPYLTQEYDSTTGKVVKESQTISYGANTHLTVVQEKNIRTGEVSQKTIEPVFGQTLIEGKVDSLGRKEVTTNHYSDDYLHVSSRTDRDGVLSLESNGDYNPATQQWVLQEINHSMGNVSTKAYGPFALPVWQADQLSITENNFDNQGHFVKSTQYKNAGTVAAPQKSDKLFENTLIESGDSKEFPAIGGINLTDNKSWIKQHDVIHGTDSVLIFDDLLGTLTAKYTTDTFTNPDGKTSTFKTMSIPQYKVDVFGAQIPYLTKEYNAATGKLVKESTTVSYDANNHLTEVQEKNVRNGEVIQKIIEPLFGQSLTETKVDSLGRKEVVTNVYSNDYLHVSSMTLRDGVLAVEAKGDYDATAKQWTLHQSRWNYNGASKFLYETVNSVLSSGGHLIYEDTVFNQNSYQYNDQNYLQENERFIPEYDINGNISRSTQGILRDGQFIPKEIREFSGYGDFFVAQNSVTKRIVDGKEIPYTSSQLKTTPEQYWQEGQLNFEVTSLAFDQANDHAKWIETNDRDGHVVAKTRQVLDEQQNVVGEQVTRFSNFNAQNIATKSATFIQQNGVETPFEASLDKTTLPEAQLGLVRTEITNQFNGLIHQELRDRRGRVIENGIEDINPQTGALEMQRKTVFSNFNDFDIARESITKSLLDGTWTPYTTSKLLSNYNDILTNHSISFIVHNDFLSNSSHGVDWLEVKDYRGHVIQLEKGQVNSNGEFNTVRRISSTYRGIPGLIDVADSTRTIMVVDGKEGILTDASRLITAHGVEINTNNINTISASSIFNSVHKVRYQGVSYFEEMAKKSSTQRDYQEIRNNLGNVEVTLFGDVDAQGHFNKNRSLYRVYENTGMNYGNFDIAKATITTAGEEGKEKVTSYSNNTTITEAERYLIYKTKKGSGAQGLVLTNDVFANHQAIADLLSKTETLQLAHQVDAMTQVKDSEGREIFIFSGYSSTAPNGFGEGDPTYVAVNQYSDNDVSQPIAIQSHTYMWNKAMGEHNQATNFTQLSSYISSQKPLDILTLNNLTFENGAATYKAKDLREIGLRTVSLRLDGTLYRSFYEGSGVEGPASYNLYFDEHELPSYGMEKDKNGHEKPYALYRSTLFDYQNKPYVLVDEFLSPQKDVNGQFLLQGKTPNSSVLMHNGTIELVHKGSAVRTTPFSSSMSLNDLGRNGMLGKALHSVMPETETEKAMDHGRQHSNYSDSQSEVLPTAKNINFEPVNWMQKVGSDLMQGVYFVGTVMGAYVLMAFLRLFGFSFMGIRASKREMNSATQQDFEDLGFTKEQSQIISDERFTNGAFLSYANFKERMESKLKNVHKLSEKKLPRAIAKARFAVALWRASKVQYTMKRGSFEEQDVQRLARAANTSVTDFMAVLKDIYGLKPEQEASYNSALKMFDKYLTTEQLRSIVASQHFQSLQNHYDKKRAVEVVLKLMFKEIRDDEKYKTAVRDRVDDIIKNTGLDKEFHDQIFALRDTFLKNIENARLLPEGFQFHDFDINTDLLAYSWDDLRKGPDMERQVRSNLVSIEKLFVFQVVFQRALFGLAGQGRAEEYLWAKYVYPSIRDSKGLNDPNILPKIKAFKQVFHAVMLDQVKERLEQNRDPKGRVLYFQNIINEEIYNDAFRYLIGQKDPTLKDAGWTLPEDVKEKVADLKDDFERALEGINDLVNLPDDQRAAAVKQKAELIKPLMLAFVGAVDQEIGMPVVKGRLAYWKLTVIPLLKMITNGEMRRRIFSSGGPYNQTATDMMRRVNNFVIVGGVTGMFAFLTINMVGLLPFMAPPLFIMTPWPIILGIGVTIATLLSSHLVKRKLVKSLNEQLKNGTKEQKEKAIKSFGTKIKWLYGLQAGLLLASMGLAPFLHLPVHMMMVWPAIRLSLHLIPILIFIDTWRLSFYAMNYFVSSLAVHNYYVANNVYEITNKSKLPQISQRLLSLFQDTTPALGVAYKTRGQERLASFINNVEEMTSDKDKYLYAEDINKGKTAKLTDTLTQLSNELVDENGQIVPAKAIELKDEIEAFVNRLSKPIVVSGVKAKRFESLGLQKLIDYVNHNYRMDKGATPRSWDHVIPTTIAIIGYGEDWYFTKGELLEVIDGSVSRTKIVELIGQDNLDKLLKRSVLEEGEKPGTVKANPKFNENEIQEILKEESIEPSKIGPLLKQSRDLQNEGVEFTHRLGMLARYKTELFLYMVNRLTKEGSKEREGLLKMIEDPTYVPEGIQEWDIWPEITEWANLQLPTGYANAVTQKRTMGRLYSYYGRIFGVTDPKAAAEDKIRVIDRNLMAMNALDKVLKGKLREMVDVLIETGYTATYKEYPDGKTRGIQNPNQVVIDNHSVLTGGDATKYDVKMLQTLLGLIINERLFPARLMGGGLNDNPLVNENFHASKWNQKTAILPFLIGPVILNLDADHRTNYVDYEFLPNHLLEYNYLPGLAVSTPIVKHTLTKGLGIFGDILPVSENAFYYHAQQGKELLGGLTAYGKLFERVSALRHSEGITDSYVAEDALTAVNYRRFGYITGRAGSVKVEKGWPFSFAAAVTPTRKWSYDSVESVSGRIAMKIFMSPLVDLPYRINNFWLDGFGFYFKKPGIVRYIRWLVAFYLVFDWNLFNKVPLAMWVGSLVLSQAISHGLFFYKIFDESNGYVKGTAKGISHLITRMYVYFVHQIFVYEETILKLASNRLGRFLATASKGANQTRVENKELMYARSGSAIKSASILALVMLTYVGISLQKSLFWATTLLMGFAGVAAPEMLNPVRIKHRLKDNSDNAKDILMAFWWGVVDNVERFQYSLANLLSNLRLTSFVNAENDLQIKVLNMVDARLPKDEPFAKIRDYPPGKRNPIMKKAFDSQADTVFELAETIYLFHQNPSHYRKMYGRVSLPVVYGLLRILSDDIKEGVDYTYESPINELTKYQELLRDERLPVVKKYLEALKKVGSLKERIAKAESNQLKEVEDILMLQNPKADQLDQADWLLTQLSWLPLDMQNRGKIRTKIANMLFGMIGVDGTLQAVSFYALLPVLLTFDKLFKSKNNKENYNKALQVPQSTVIPLSPPGPVPSIEQKIQEQQQKADTLQQDVNQKIDQFDQENAAKIRQIRESGIDVNAQKMAIVHLLTGGKEGEANSTLLNQVGNLMSQAKDQEEALRSQGGGKAEIAQIWSDLDLKLAKLSAVNIPEVVGQSAEDINAKLENIDQTVSQLKEKTEKPKPNDQAMATAKKANSGGIDLSKTSIKVEAPQGTIELNMDDKAMLGLLLNADGLDPIIYNIKVMAPSNINHFLGLDY